MGIGDIFVLIMSGLSIWKIWDGTSSLTARLMMFGFLGFILSSLYL
ncbi:hypothetical protein SAMN06296036_12010 [Pseudobacteriovorax antillogorgiicola]|uniref:Uncharacterized protein n=1 Tax=Pseudobacteriovorax antillogorgiicola TaxID=1513793 RepID=A0A1Y6CKV5_9BACT|nr:hypothetical protein EDD56_120130 [Pseudobacteriovorax antillogorgiicola]SMF59519.1 hypothetical protein SAMN06296036_12010 [Pseudobacteriovorax antillogorgiicola]